MKRAQFAAGAAAVMTAGPRAVWAQSARSIRVGAIPFDPAAEVYYAQDQGFFERAGLAVEVTPFTSGGAIATAVVSGALDIGFTNVFSAITAYGRGILIVALALSTSYVVGSPYSAILVLKDAPYRAAKDLNGKTVAVDGLKGLTQIATQAWVDKHGGDSSSLKFVEVPEPNIAEAVRQGRVDAGTLQLTNVDLTGQSPVRSFGDPYEGIAPRFAPALWFAMRPWVAAHRDEAGRFSEAMRQTARWANGNQGASAEILMRVAKLTPERMQALSTHRVRYAETLDPKLIQPLIDVSARYGLITATFPAQALL
jgi:NitT/TauT family transport system substrate-binding protein